MNDLELLVLRSISSDARIIAYRPRLRKIAGSVASTILLQQIVFRWENNDFQPFYKYKEPCAASDYRKGDSWCEELGFSREEFDTALKHISQKVKGPALKDYSQRDHDKLVWYWVMPDRKTWYEVNYVALCKVATPLYVRREPHVTSGGNPALPILYTENTSEITSETTTTTRDREPEVSRSRRQAGPDTFEAVFTPTEPKVPPTVEKVTERTRQNDPAYDRICTLVENEGLGMLTPLLASQIKAAMDKHPPTAIEKAIEIAVRQNKRFWSYVAGILLNMEREGYNYDKGQFNRERSGGHGRTPAEESAETRRQRDYNERYTSLVADEINKVISPAVAAAGWAELEASFPGYEYRELPRVR